MECKSKDFSLHEEGIESLAPDLLQKAAERYAAVFLSAEMSKVVILISFLSRNESDIYSQSDSDFTMPSPVSLVYASYLLQNEEKSYSSMAYGMRFWRAGEGFRISCISRPSSKGATAHAIAVLQWLMLKKYAQKVLQDMACHFCHI